MALVSGSGCPGVVLERKSELSAVPDWTGYIYIYKKKLYCRAFGYLPGCIHHVAPRLQDGSIMFDDRSGAPHHRLIHVNGPALQICFWDNLEKGNLITIFFFQGPGRL